jgi:FdhE protein
MDKQLQRLRQAREQKPNYREVLDLAERMLVEKCRARDQRPSPSISIDPVKAQKHAAEGIPYLRFSEPLFDPSQVAHTFSCLLESFQELNPARFQPLKEAVEARNWEFDRVLGRLLRNQVSEKTLEEEMGPEGSLLFFFLVQSLKPVLENLAEEWRSVLKDLPWNQGFCPFCGAFPGMAEIRAEGRRFLHCLLCGTEWESPRLQCPYCQSGDPEQHTYFQVEGEIENRVDVCLTCHHYLKTVDSREMEGPLDFEVEDYLTLHLDHLAQEEGYLRPEKLFVEIG